MGLFLNFVVISERGMTVFDGLLRVVGAGVPISLMWMSRFGLYEISIFNAPLNGCITC